jgi:DNA invertase Pin-like site-specific DNA recombinase
MDMLGVFAEFENNLRRDRQMEGIRKAKAEGRYNGRPRSIGSDQRKKIIRLKKEGIGATEIGKRIGVSRRHVYRIFNE